MVRRASISSVGKWLLRTLGTDADSIAFFEEASARSLHRRKLEAYETGLRPLLGPTRSLGLEVGAEAVEMVEVRGTRLAIASFNSAWFSQGDSDQGKLWLGEPGVSRALDRIADEEAAFAISLLHHPFGRTQSSSALRSQFPRETLEHPVGSWARGLVGSWAQAGGSKRWKLNTWIRSIIGSRNTSA